MNIDSGAGTDCPQEQGVGAGAGKERPVTNPVAAGNANVATAATASTDMAVDGSDVGLERTNLGYKSLLLEELEAMGIGDRHVSRSLMSTYITDMRTARS